MIERQRGWFSDVPANGFQNRPQEQRDNVSSGLSEADPDIVIETTPEHRNLVAGDPECAGWVRHPDDAGVRGRRDHLRANNGIPDLELVDPDNVERAVELFYRDGFVAVRDALAPDVLADIKAATDRVMEEVLDADPDGSIGGGAGGLPHRYSFGATSASRHRLHDPAWAALIDQPTTFFE